MDGLDLYARLSLSRAATPDEINQAYRAAARRFHPDANPEPLAAEEFRRLTEAYETLNDPARRATYDDALDAPGAPAEPLLQLRVTASRTLAPALNEPQVVYLLAEISTLAHRATAMPAPPINLCLVLDRSTSMQGMRLEQVKAATLHLIDHLTERDTFAVVAFSDRAEVVVPAQGSPDRTLAKAKVSTLRADGGTEILQGLIYDLSEVQQHVSPTAINTRMLLTDGRTYGDETDCLMLAGPAGGDGITIHGLGIGDEWNDAFLDDLAARTGGATFYIRSPEAVGQFFREQMQGLNSTYAERLRLEAVTEPGVKLQSVFRLMPKPAALPASPQPIRLGSLTRGGMTTVLLELLIPPRQPGKFSIARLTVSGDVLGLGRMGERASAEVSVEVRDQASATVPPPRIVSALSHLTLYQMQEKAAAEVAAGQLDQATRRLERLASRLLADGEQALAQQALAEAGRLGRSKHISAEGQKQLKYGTRALIARPGNKREDTPQ